MEIYDVTSLIDVPATASDGHFVVEDQSITTPLLNLSP
jgi:hypothetical protein